jgi:hypothetical protein
MSSQQEAVDSLNLKADHGSPPIALADPFRRFAAQVARYWWIELAVGVLWLVIAGVVLKFDDASVVTVGVLTRTDVFAVHGGGLRPCRTRRERSALPVGAVRGADDFSRRPRAFLG